MDPSNKSKQRLIFFVLFLMMCASLSPSVKKDTIYVQKESTDIFLEKSTARSKVIGKQFSQVFFKRDPNLSESVCRYLKINPNDTVIVLTTGISTQPFYEQGFIKYGNTIKFFRYWMSANKWGLRQNARFESCNYANYAGVIDPQKVNWQISEMIMMNVIFNWNIQDIECLIKSSRALRKNMGWNAYRYVLRDNYVTQYSHIDLGGASNWHLRECYGKQLPKRYLRDLRYETDSTLEKYMDNWYYKEFYFMTPDEIKNL